MTQGKLHLPSCPPQGQTYGGSLPLIHSEGNQMGLGMGPHCQGGEEPTRMASVQFCKVTKQENREGDG